MMMKIDPIMLKKMVRAAISTHPDEITCGECFGEIDRFVEMTLDGKNAAEAMPLVEDHLQRCQGCREEFEVLLSVLETLHDEE